MVVVQCFGFNGSASSFYKTVKIQFVNCWTKNKFAKKSANLFTFLELGCKCLVNRSVMLCFCASIKSGYSALCSQFFVYFFVFKMSIFSAFFFEFSCTVQGVLLSFFL